MRKADWRLLLGLLTLPLLVACGKVGAPIAPELASPQSVEFLQAQASPDGVNFRWQSPAKDQRGKELDQIDGYRVYRKTLENEAEMIDTGTRFDLLAEIPDTHLQILTELREQAEASGKIARKVQVSDELKQFAYLDATPAAGLTYAYKIVPVNQGSVEGEALRLVRVRFQGEKSSVTLFDDSGALAARPTKDQAEELIEMDDSDAEQATTIP